MDLLAVIGWPVLDRIRIGPLAISPHGIGIAVGYLAGAWWMVREGRKRGLDDEKVGSLVLWALVGAIVGARFFYVLGHLEDYDSFGEMVAIWEGGISLVGGIFGAVLLAYPFMRRYGYRFFQVMDSAAIGLAFGIMVGRIGDLVIGDHLGKPTDFFLGWAYRGGILPGPWREIDPGEWQAQLEGGYSETLSREGARLLREGDLVAQGPGIHQTALYDLLIAGALFLFLLWLNRRPRREGVLILTFAIWYGAGRIVTDFLRIDKTWLFGLTGSQWASVGVIAISLLVLLRFATRPLGKVGEPDGTPAGTAGAAPEGEKPSTSFTPPREPGGRR
ncbi:MAG TPA: prolipoprotein diacylglyceryl transferase [Actinomycetota bacterium]|nr:prolipoprotein diacylglyceryl transferase [Actinomycetota bacterium]